MDLIAILFYAGGVTNMLDRNKGFWQSVFWPVAAGRLINEMIHEYANSRDKP